MSTCRELKSIQTYKVQRWLQIWSVHKPDKDLNLIKRIIPSLTVRHSPFSNTYWHIHLRQQETQDPAGSPASLKISNSALLLHSLTVHLNPHEQRKIVIEIPEERHEPRPLVDVFRDGEPQSWEKPMLLIPELFILLDWIHRMCLSAPLLRLNLSQQLKVHCQNKFCSANLVEWLNFRINRTKI